MQEAASIGGGHAVMISPDDRDVSYLVNRFQTNDQAPAETTQQLNLWVAEGPWLVLLALPLLLPLFRRGILTLLLPAVFVISSSLSQDLYAEAETAVGSSAGKAAQFWQNLWQTQDQQAQQIYQTGDARGAAERFKDPRWKQVSHYQSGAYEDALASLDKPETSADWYNRGNTLARMGKLEGAIKAYDEALKQNPEYEDASYNRKLLEELQQNQQQQSGQSDQQSEQQDGSDSEQSSQQQKGDASQQNDQQGNSERQSQGESGEQSSSQNDQQSDSAQQQSKSNQNSDSGSQDGQDKNHQPDSEQNSTQQMEQQLKDKIDQQLSEQQSKNAQQSGSPKDQGEKPQKNQSANVQQNSEPIDEESAAREQLLNRIEDDPAGLWRRKFIYQYRQQADGQAVEDQQW
jgi:Ca-activated chloride channel family protein